MGRLAVLLAKESFFGRDVMAHSTVSGLKSETKPLPKMEIMEIKKIIYSLCSGSCDQQVFDKTIWCKCKDSINHACNSHQPVLVC